MIFALLIIADESKPKLPEPQMKKLGEEYRALAHQLTQAGQFRGALQLQPTTTSTTVRQEGGSRVVSDGPFSSGSQQLAGHYLVECANLDEAIDIAARIPGVRLGELVEVRPVVPMPQP